MKTIYGTAAIATITVASLVAIDANSAIANSVTIGQNFTGSNVLESGFFPPNTMGAVGNDQFVELINGRYTVYSKTGDRLRSSSLDQFWWDAGVTDLTSFSFDPRIVFDPTSQRWFAASVDNQVQFGTGNRILLGVSKTANPLDGWQGFALNSSANQTLFADFTTLGLNADGVYLGANMFTGRGGTFQNLSLISVPKADLLASTPSVDRGTFFYNEPVTQRGFTVQPAVDFGPSTGRAALLSGNGEIRRSSILNGGTGQASLTGATLLQTPLPIVTPPPATQPNGVGIDTFDARFTGSVVKVGGSLWATQTVQDQGRAAIRWYEIRETDNVILQTGTIGDPNHDYYYPSIAVNAFGQVVIGCNRSGSTEFISSYAIVGTTVNGQTTFAAPLLLKAGTSNYVQVDPANRNRWGDYSATTIDPQDPLSFWTIQAIATDRDIWTTQITQLRFNPVQKVPEPFTGLTLLGLGAAGLMVRRWQTA
jgi:hypothetical protein